MIKYIALLRGINVGGNNMIKMTSLKAAFEHRGFQNVSTYINSGNVLFESDQGEQYVQNISESLLRDDLGMNIPVCVITAYGLAEAVSNAPRWWNRDADTRHDAFFIIPPATAEQVVTYIGRIKAEFENLAYHGRVIFWSATMLTFSRTRVSKITKDKAMYRAMTVRNANTTLKLVELSKK